MLKYGPVSSHFDFDSTGKRRGFIDLNHSDDRHAFSLIRLPVGIISGKPGPTLLMTAGNHGDEYEGQVICNRIMQNISPEHLSGRIILLPALNLPAVRARTRVSPLDNGNMNRCFPGHPDNGPTAAIAGFVNQHLIPMADVILDFHSGGTATKYIDCGYLCWGADDDLNQANLTLADAFGADFTMLQNIDGTGGDFDTAAYQQATRFLSCELGGMGSLSSASVATGLSGVYGVLNYLGMYTLNATISPPKETRLIDVSHDVSYITSAHDGLASWDIALSQTVKTGDHLATIYHSHNVGEILAEIHSPQDGIVAVQRRNPLVEPGDHLFMICRQMDRSTHC